MSDRDRVLLGLAAGLALGRTLPPEVSVIVTLALLAWLVSYWIVTRLAGGER